MPASSSAPRPVVAIFDVDGTLTTGDCVFPFLRRATGRRLATALLGRPLTFGAALLRRDRDRLKELACSALAGLPAEDVERLGVEFAHTIVAQRLRDDTTTRLRRHRELGHTAIFASASLDPYLVPLAELLGADDVVCTWLERGGDGRLTGRLVGRNCRAAEKARRVHEHLAAHGLADAELWAYGDSRDDEPLLEMADHGVRVGRRALSDLDTGG